MPLTSVSEVYVVVMVLAIVGLEPPLFIIGFVVVILFWLWAYNLTVVYNLLTVFFDFPLGIG